MGLYSYSFHSHISSIHSAVVYFHLISDFVFMMCVSFYMKPTDKVNSWGTMVYWYKEIIWKRQI